MKKYEIKILSQDHAKLILEKLYELGYEWQAEEPSRIFAYIHLNYWDHGRITHNNKCRPELVSINTESVFRHIKPVSPKLYKMRIDSELWDPMVVKASLTREDTYKVHEFFTKLIRIKE